jgi:hypothetical protein
MSSLERPLSGYSLLAVEEKHRFEGIRIKNVIDNGKRSACIMSKAKCSVEEVNT